MPYFTTTSNASGTPGSLASLINAATWFPGTAVAAGAVGATTGRPVETLLQQVDPSDNRFIWSVRQGLVGANVTIITCTAIFYMTVPPGATSFAAPGMRIKTRRDDVSTGNINFTLAARKEVTAPPSTTATRVVATADPANTYTFLTISAATLNGALGALTTGDTLRIAYSNLRYTLHKYIFRIA
jgi:hypothetical protein